MDEKKKRRKSAPVRLSPKSLENRRLLNASFMLDGTELTFDFTTISDLAIGENVSDSNIVEFELSSGEWTMMGMANSGLTFDMNVLSLDTSLISLSQLMILGGGDLGMISQEAGTSLQVNTLDIFWR